MHDIRFLPTSDMPVFPVQFPTQAGAFCVEFACSLRCSGFPHCQNTYVWCISTQYPWSPGWSLGTALWLATAPQGC